jgi:hypothetical protein
MKSEILPKTHPVRKIIREILSISFWIHALCVSHFASFQIIPSISKFTAAIVYNLTLIAFIGYYSYFSSSGWFSVLYDLFYVLLWPFLMIFRAVWLAIRGSYRFVRKRAKLKPLGLITVRRAEPKVVPSSETSGEKVSFSEAIRQLRNTKEQRPLTLRERALRPVQQFVLLWSILIVSLQNRPLIIFACLVTLYGAFKAVYTLWNLLTDSSSWLEKLKSSFAAQVAAKIRQVREWEEASGTEGIASEVNVLKLFESFFSFISDNRSLLARCTAFFAALITIPFYLYVSLLFASIYVGVARIEGIEFSWVNAFSDSLYIPFAFTDLPHSFVIRGIAGLQAIAVTVMGWNICFRQLGSKLDGITSAATELCATFDQDDYRQKSAMVAIIAENEPIALKRKPVARAEFNRNRSQRRAKSKTGT